MLSGILKFSMLPNLSNITRFNFEKVKPCGARRLRCSFCEPPRAGSETKGADVTLILQDASQVESLYASRKVAEIFFPGVETTACYSYSIRSGVRRHAWPRYTSGLLLYGLKPIDDAHGAEKRDAARYSALPDIK
jgi:hypothetical protein